ncbi:MAG: nicotinate phosphoribosyltransferase, partial [Psychrobacter sp.]
MTATYSPIITSLLDNDLYKFTMLQAMLHQFPQTHGVYRFRCRNNEDTLYPLADIKEQLEQQLDSLCELRFLEDELEYLRGLRFMRSDFVDYLELFKLKRRFITVSTDGEGRLFIDIEGPMIQAMFFEVFVLAIVNELYFDALSDDTIIKEGQRRLDEKVELLHQYALEQTKESEDTPPFIVADFGTRRRFSKSWQAHVVQTLHHAQPKIISGTSNVYLAKTLG